jgi:hypothetical protein
MTVLRILPDEEADVVLAAVVDGDGGDGSAHDNLAVGLNESSTEEIVATGCLVRIALDPKSSKYDQYMRACI